MRVLITNSMLAGRTGSELYVRDLALGLLRRGHRPVVYSPRPGELARRLRMLTVPVVDDLDSLTATPDIIHGQHNLEAAAAVLNFPGVPAVFFCHGWTFWVDAPPILPRVKRYVAVDETCLDRLVCECGVPPARTRLVFNSVDLERFERRTPLPSTPRRALVFSNYANEFTHAHVCRVACERAGISVDVVGSAAGTTTDSPESVLKDYDLVFAKGRSALEALAVGAAVILCDLTGGGPLVTTAELERLRRLNFGIRALQSPLTVEAVAAQIARYDAEDAASVSARVRESAGLEGMLDQIVSLYEEVIDEHSRSEPVPADEELRATSAYLRWLGAAVDKSRQDFAKEIGNRSLTLRVRNKLPHVPAFGRVVRKLFPTE
jgi:hypothetical protein